MSAGASPVDDLVRTAQRLADTHEPGEAFHAYFAYLVEQEPGGRGPAEAGGRDLEGMERALLKGAQQAGTIRPDVTHADVLALAVACAARPSGAARQRMTDIVLTGLGPAPA